MTAPLPDGLSTLRRIARSRSTPDAAERCDMCAVVLDADHQHVVDLETRKLLCACRPCALLFIDERAHLRFRTVPSRYLSFDDPVVDERSWEELQIPVGLAFLFHNSAQHRMVAFYPGPAGATESELDLAGWQRIIARHPSLATMRPDVEALLLRRGAASFLVPIDACYELVGQLRTLWRGFDGGQEANDAIGDFFARVEQRSKPAETS